jgi:hypothetical protein
MNRTIGIVAALLLLLPTAAAPAPPVDATTVKVALTDMSAAMGMGPAGRGMMGQGMIDDGHPHQSAQCQGRPHTL